MDDEGDKALVADAPGANDKGGLAVGNIFEALVTGKFAEFSL